jgi:hypothetical protein
VLVFAIIVQIRHYQRDTIKDYWSTLDQYFMAFYSNTETDRWYHVLRFVRFSDNKNEHDKTDRNSTDWNTRALSDKLSDESYAKY